LEKKPLGVTKNVKMNELGILLYQKKIHKSGYSGYQKISCESCTRCVKKRKGVGDNYIGEVRGCLKKKNLHCTDGGERLSKEGV